MKILFLTHRIPYPLNDGGNIAMNSMLHSLSASGAEIKMLSLNTDKHYFNIEKLPLVYREKYHVEDVPINTDILLSDALRNLFTNSSYNIIRFWSVQMADRIANELMKHNYDLVHFESLFMAPYLDVVRKVSNAKCVMRSHNIEHVIWERMAQREKSILKKWYINFLSRRLKIYEEETSPRFDAILSITDEDKNYFQLHLNYQNVIAAPLGVNIEQYPLQEANENSFSLFHLGSMDWMPNMEAVEWFLENCWPLIARQHHSLKLFLAGRNFPSTLKSKRIENVFFDGEISNPENYMQNKHLMVVPILSGGGMRVKIIEGMARGKCIISTSIGAEGIKYENKKNILIANTPQEFAETITWCLQNKNESIEIGKSARQLVEEKYSEQAIGKQVSLYYKSLINRND